MNRDRALGLCFVVLLLAALSMSVLAYRKAFTPVDWVTLRTLHRALLRIAPSLGVAVALAVVDGEVAGPEAGLRALDAMTDPAVQRFQPAWTARAHLLAAFGSPGPPRRPTAGPSTSPTTPGSSHT